MANDGLPIFHANIRMLLSLSAVVKIDPYPYSPD